MKNPLSALNIRCYIGVHNRPRVRLQRGRRLQEAHRWWTADRREQQSTVSLEFGDEGAQLGLVVGWRRVVKALTVPIGCHRVMMAFTDIDADKNIDGVTLSCVEVYAE